MVHVRACLPVTVQEFVRLQPGLRGEVVDAAGRPRGVYGFAVVDEHPLDHRDAPAVSGWRLGAG